MLDRCDEQGFTSTKLVVGHSKNGRNKWRSIQTQKPVFPLIEANLLKQDIENYWKGKPVRFAKHNNCVGCFHRHPLFLAKMADEHPNKMQWFADRETVGSTGHHRTWRSDTTYQKIISAAKQLEIGFEDLSDCDSGYCGL